MPFTSSVRYQKCLADGTLTYRCPCTERALQTRLVSASRSNRKRYAQCSSWVFAVYRSSDDCRQAESEHGSTERDRMMTNHGQEQYPVDTRVRGSDRCRAGASPDFLCSYSSDLPPAYSLVPPAPCSLVVGIQQQSDLNTWETVPRSFWPNWPR